MITALTGFLAVPKRVLERPEAPLLFLVHTLLLVLQLTTRKWLFLPSFVLTCLALAFFVWRETIRHTLDERRFERLYIYLFYSLLSITGLFLILLDGFPPLEPSKGTTVLSWVGKTGILMTTTSSLALFPLHSWLPMFLAAPRLNLFLPIFAIQLGMVILFRVVAPLIQQLPEIRSVLSFLSAVGLIYSALLLFGEVRLKRIIGYLVVSHVSLMVLALSAGGVEELTGPRLDGANVVLASAGLLTILAILASRFGRQGIETPAGLASLYPEVSICFLTCTLSLVGFPGTFGYISEEILFRGSFEYKEFLLSLSVVALALNSYSCFRIFARIFYGRPSYVPSDTLALSRKERTALLLIVFFLLLNGLMPGVILSLEGL